MVLDRRVMVFYLLSFLGGMVYNVTAPFFIVYGLSLHFSILAVAALFGARRIGVFLFEVPTGLFADIYGRKISVLMTYVLGTLSSVLFFITTDYSVLFIASLLAGIALTFSTGAFEALVVDSLGLADQEDLRNKVFIRMGVASTVGFVAGGLAGSAISFVGLRYIWLLQSFLALLALCIAALFLRKKQQYGGAEIQRAHKRTRIRQILSTAAGAIVKTGTVRSLFIVAILMVIAEAFYLVGWPIVLKDILGIPVQLFGILSAAGGVLYLVGSLVAERHARSGRTMRTLVAAALGLAAAYALFGASWSVGIAVIALLLVEFFNGSYSPLFYSFVNRFIPSEERATFLSFYSVVTDGAYGVGETFAGVLLMSIAAPLLITFSALCVIAGSLFLSRIRTQ